MDYKTLYEKLKKDNEKYIREEQKKVKIWFSQQAGKRAKMRALDEFACYFDGVKIESILP